MTMINEKIVIQKYFNNRNNIFKIKSLKLNNSCVLRLHPYIILSSEAEKVTALRQKYVISNVLWPPSIDYCLK